MNTHTRRLAILLIGIAGVAAACGESSGSDEGVPLAPQGAVEPTPPASTPPESVDAPQPPPSVGDLPAPDLSNNNDTTTPLGALCWARQNVVLALTTQLANAAQQRSVDAAALASALTASREQLTKAQPLLPPELAAFASRFAEDLTEATTKGVTADTIATAFDFEAYPDLDVYLRLAQASPSCPTP